MNFTMSYNTVKQPIGLVHFLIQIFFHNVGSYEVSYLVSNYGRSEMNDELSLVDRNDVIYQYQLHSGKIWILPLVVTNSVCSWVTLNTVVL